MSRYIDAEKIKFEPIDITVKGITHRTVERMATETEIDAMPTADVEEVIRCKDCKFRYTQTCFAKHETADNDFCSCGAKMDKEKEK